MKIICSLLICLCICMLLKQSVMAEQKDENWIDPLDMVNFDPSSNKMRVNTVSTTRSPHGTHRDDNKATTDSVSEKMVDAGTMNKDSCTTGSTCSILFKQYIRRLLYHVKGKVSDDLTKLNMRIKLSAGQTETLQNFVDGSTDNDMHNAHAVIEDMIDHVSQVHEGDYSVQRLWLEDLIGIRIELALPLTMIACVVFVTGVFLVKLKFSWWHVSVKLIFFMFCISVIWTWYELYKREEAATHHALMKDMPEECKQRDANASWWSNIKHILSSSFTFETDMCVTYYQHMITDPMWKVAPTKALAVTIVNFFLAPLREVGIGIKEFVTALLSGLPYQLWPVVLISIAVFVFLLLFMGFGYRLSLPLIAIEPTRQYSLENGADIRDAIELQSKELKVLKEMQEDQLKKMKEVLLDDRKSIAEYIHNHTVSVMPSLMSGSSSPEKEKGGKQTQKEDRGGQGDNPGHAII